jgi:elongation factor G
MLDATPVLLEPVMDVEIILPEEYLGDVIADLNMKRARIMGIDSREGGLQVAKVLVPLGEMFGYSTDLRSATQGRANFTMQFSAYDIVPENMSNKIVKKIRGL